MKKDCSRIVIRLVSAFCLITMQLMASDGNLRENLTIEDFKLGGINYSIVGSSARVTEDYTYIEKLQARFYREGGDLLLFTPECTFDQAKKSGHSDKQIHLRSRSFTIDGVGFDLNFERRRIIVKSNVKVRIFDYSKNLLGR
jgi:hypothetical protein